MCVVSMVTDHYIDRWGRWIPGPYYPSYPNTNPDPGFIRESYLGPQPLTPAERAKETQQFKDLIERARKYDKDNNEPDCELDEKRKALKKIADELGIDISFV